MGKITINLLTTRNAIPTVNDILLDRNANQYFIVAGEENATTFQISYDSSAFSGYDFYVEMVNASGFGIQKTKLENNSTTDWVISDTEFYLPVGMAVAGYGYISITAEKNAEKIVFMPVKVKVQNTIPDWAQGISEGSSVYLDNGYLYYRSKDGTVTNLGYVKGSDGEDGNGILSVAKTATVGLVDTYTIIFTNGNSTTFNVTNGEDGKGISSIAKTSTSGLVDTYTITFTDGSSTTFNVTNGADGQDGITPHIGVNNHWYIGNIDTGVSAVCDGSNPNILINPVFNINQRTTAGSTTSGSTTNAKYVVDKWYIPQINNSSYIVSVSPPSSSRNYLRCATADVTGAIGLVSQIVEDFNKYKGKYLTFSVKLIKDLGLPSNATWELLINDGVSLTNTLITDSQLPGVFSVTRQIDANATELTVTIGQKEYTGSSPESASTAVCVEWAKLEVGETATEFTAPDKGTEFVKCCRYFYAKQRVSFGNGGSTILGFATSADTFEAVLYLPTGMRIIPTVTFSTSISGVKVLQVNTDGTTIEASVTAVQVSSIKSFANQVILKCSTTGLLPYACGVLDLGQRGLSLDADQYPA